MGFLRIILLISLSLCFAGNVARAARPDWCAKMLAHLSDPTSEKVTPELETVDDMLWAFSNGLIPDPKNPAQLRAFEVYLKMRFGDSKNATDGGSLGSVVDRIAEALKKHPELNKIPFRNYQMSTAERSYPVTEKLQVLLKTPVEAAGQARGNLFQIEANLGYWKRALNWEEAPQPPNLDGKQKKEWSKQEKEKFIAYLDQVIPAELREALKNTPTHHLELRAGQLFRSLSDQRQKMLAAHKDVGPISRAMVDLVHTIGFHDKEIQAGLKSEDGLKRVAALRRALDARDQFAMSLGYPGYFEEVLKKLGVPAPSGIDSNRAFQDRMTEAEQDVMAKVVIKTSQGSLRGIRQLSLIEAPFRSCIGGSDCSSRTYLTRALDPNYQYFTLTDNEGYSSGHVTVVLGAVPGKASRIPLLGKGEPERKIAFIDKIQNVPHEDLPIMLEAIRRSLLEKGYTLALPEDLGDHNGISNAAETREFVKRWIKTQDETIPGFKPHPHSYTFDSQYSRADKGLAVRPLAPLELPGHVKLSPTEEAYAWRAGDLDLNKLVLGSRKLKHGTVEEKIRYIEAQKTIKSAGLERDPEFEKTVEGWLADVSLPFQLRKRVLLYRWLDEGSELPELIAHLKPGERIDLVQNILDTPRLRDGVLKKKNQLPALLVLVRSNKKLVATLADSYAREHQSAIARVLGATDISDSAALAILRQIKQSFATQNMGEATAVLRLVANTSVEGDIKRGLMDAYVANVSNYSRLAREIGRHLSHDNVGTRQFAKDVLALTGTSTSKSPVMRAVNEIEQIATEEKVSHREAAERWLSDPAKDKELKTEYLRAHVTAPDFEKLEARLPSSQKKSVLEAVEKKTNALLFRKLALERGVPRELLSHLTAESFDYEGFHFKPGGEKVTLGSPPDEPGRYGADENQREVTLTKPFGIGASQVTQLEWVLVMDEPNPSKFVNGPGAIEITLSDGRKTKVLPNHPVEQVSWNDVVTRFLPKMNKLDPGNSYRLPTEAEWEFAGRAGTQTRYSHGDAEDELGQYAWTNANAGGTTHAVAELKPNRFGLYDMHGNVWEWVSDRWESDTSKLGGVDPTGPESGSYRVIRGGSWFNDPRHARSAYRNAYDPGARGDGLGFRLVRTPK